MTYGAQHCQAGKRRERSREARRRRRSGIVRPLMDFSSWSEYVADFPPVLLVRVTPRLVEASGRRSRAAPRRRKALPCPHQALQVGFSRMRAFCGDAEVRQSTRSSSNSASRERRHLPGLYVFDPGALSPQCGASSSWYSEKEPEKGNTSGRSEGAPADLAGLRTISRREIVLG
jgi:hypothetical protein